MWNCVRCRRNDVQAADCQRPMAMRVLPESEWLALGAAHEARVRPWVEPRLARMSHGKRHPVEDFLFEYYSYRPGQLLRWHPGLGVALEGGGSYLQHKGYRQCADGLVTADPQTLSPERRKSLQWLRAMLALTASRPAAFGCFGLHEWAMVYRAESIRHEQWPLRLGADAIAQTVEALVPRCTHYDAFRFFTPAARPLNKLALTREAIPANEQPGCLHANMDLYKWAFKLSPFASSDLIADTFALAREIRLLDMQASPYDFRELGLAPVCVETPAGRAEYETRQREFAEKAIPLRLRLTALCDTLLASSVPSPAPARP